MKFNDKFDAHSNKFWIPFKGIILSWIWSSNKLSSNIEIFKMRKVKIYKDTFFFRKWETFSFSNAIVSCLKTVLIVINNWIHRPSVFWLLYFPKSKFRLVIETIFALMGGGKFLLMFKLFLTHHCPEFRGQLNQRLQSKSKFLTNWNHILQDFQLDIFSRGIQTCFLTRYFATSNNADKGNEKTFLRLF